MYSTAANPFSGFGVVLFWHPHVSSIFSGKLASANELPDTQLFTDDVNRPPCSVRSPAKPRLMEPLPENVLSLTRFPDRANGIVISVGGNGLGYSKPNSPTLT